MTILRQILAGPFVILSFCFLPFFGLADLESVRHLGNERGRSYCDPSTLASETGHYLGWGPPA
jgi:hypothetical protein